MPVVFDALLVELCHNALFGLMSLIQEFFFGAHGRPLKGRKRFWNKKGGAGDNLHSAIYPLFFGHSLEEDSCNLVGELSDSSDIFWRLGGQSQHKVQFYPGPAARKGQGGAFQNDFFGQSLIDHVPKTLTAGFRGKGEAALFDILYLAHDI